MKRACTQFGFPGLAKTARPGAPLSLRHPASLKSLHRATVACCAIALVFLFVIPFAAAQEERPQIPVGERKAPRKKDAGPRAIAVLQMSKDGKKMSLVPIAILINGKFWDASAYKADPVPMSLDPGTVYEAEQTGSSLGLFTVNNALHSNARNSDAPWIATGAWHPTGSDEPKPSIKADKAPVGITAEDNGPPRLTHDTSAAKTTPARSGSAPAAGSSTSATPSSNAPPASSSKSGGGSGEDEPPRLSKGSSASSSASADSAPPASGTPAKPEDSKPAITVEGKSNIPTSDSGTAETNRPRLRRGKPAESFADEDVPGYSRPGASTSPEKREKSSEAKAAQEDFKFVPAISDASGPPPHSYAYEWLKGDEEDRRKQITALAKEQVQAYVIAQDKAKIRTTAPQPGKRASVKVSEPILENEQMTAYDLWNSNQPIIVYSAEAHMPAPASTSADVNSNMRYSIMLVAYPDIYNNLHKLYSGVTDRLHLDVTPKLELVDAVDADGDNRGELLFREVSDAGNGWIVYRATADKLFKMFDSLNPE